MSWVYRYIAMAVGAAGQLDLRHYRVGAVGIRADGAVVQAKNLPVLLFTVGVNRPNPYPQVHAEMNCLRKMDSGGVVFVARVRKNGATALARPCKHCMKALRQWRVKKVWYTTASGVVGEIP